MAGTPVGASFRPSSSAARAAELGQRYRLDELVRRRRIRGMSSRAASFYFAEVSNSAIFLKSSID